METHDKEFEELLVARVTDRVETGILEQESKRFRNLYIIVGFASFIGFGVVSQLVDFYATRAIESKLEEAKQELDSAKMFAQLLALATKLDLSDSFTRSDRDTVVVLLERAKGNTALRSEPAFASLLLKIIDSLASSDNPMHVSKIASLYPDECSQNPEIAITLLQHYGRAYLSEVNVADKAAAENLTRLGTYIRALSGHDAKGAAAGFQVLSEFKRNGMNRTKSLDELIASLSVLQGEDKKQFATVILGSTDPERMAKRPTPEILRVAGVARKFIESYRSEVEPILNGDSIDRIESSDFAPE